MYFGRGCHSNARSFGLVLQGKSLDTTSNPRMSPASTSSRQVPFHESRAEKAFFELRMHEERRHSIKLSSVSVHDGDRTQ